MHPLLRKLKVASLRLARQSKAALLRLAARPRSLERLLLFTTAGLLLFSIAVISLASLGYPATLEKLYLFSRKSLSPHLPKIPQQHTINSSQFDCANRSASQRLLI